MFAQSAWKLLFILRNLAVGNKFMAGLVSTHLWEACHIPIRMHPDHSLFFPHHELHSMGKALRKSEAKTWKEIRRSRKHKDGEFSEMSSITCRSLAAEVPRVKKHANLKEHEDIYRTTIWPSNPTIWTYTLEMKVLVAQSCPTLCNPMDCSPPGSTVHGISQVGVLEWGAISFSRGSFWLRDQTCIFFVFWWVDSFPLSNQMKPHTWISPCVQGLSRLL